MNEQLISPQPFITFDKVLMPLFIIPKNAAILSNIRNNIIIYTLLLFSQLIGQKQVYVH